MGSLLSGLPLRVMTARRVDWPGYAAMSCAGKSVTRVTQPGGQRDALSSASAFRWLDAAGVGPRAPNPGESEQRPAAPRTSSGPFQLRESPFHPSALQILDRAKDALPDQNSYDVAGQSQFIRTARA
jgi:hypothetical protein